MTVLLRRASRRYLTRHPTQLVLAILGVGLGVSVMVSIDIASDSALRAFELSSAELTGRATHRIVGGPEAVPESLYRELRVDHGVRGIAPVVAGWVALPDYSRRLIRLMGVDSFADAAFRSFVAPGTGTEVDLEAFLTLPGAILLPAATAEELGLVTGDELHVVAGTHRTTLTLTGLLGAGRDTRAAANLAIADVATAQEVLLMEGRLSRIELVSDPSSPDGVPPDLVLPPGLRVETTSGDAGTAQQMTRAFRLNLQALSLLALLCGAFLIYNTMTFAVVQRRELLGLLRAVGTTRRQVLEIVLGEALSIGALGTLLGCLGGAFLGRQLVHLVTRTINDLYFVVEVRELALSPLLLVKAVLLGVLTSLVAATLPALEAARVDPRSALVRSELEERVRRLVPRLGAVGLLIAGAGAALLFLPGERLLLAFAALFAILLGLALLTPAVTLGLMRLATPLSGAVGGRIGLMASRGVVRSLSRTGVAIAALMMAVSVAVGVDLMIGSFRATVTHWLDYALPADLYVSLPSSIANRFAGFQAGFGPEEVQRLSELPTVSHVDTVRHFETATNVGVVQAAAVGLGREGRDGYRFVDGDPASIWRAVLEKDAVVVSESFSHRHGLVEGSRLDLQTPAGPYESTVAGVFYGYATERGLFLLGAETYRRLWRDQRVTAMGIHLLPGVSAVAATTEVRALLGEGTPALVRSHHDLRRDSLVVFERTFAITAVLKTLAVIVAFVGVLSALLALSLERGREMAVLRACGLTPAELWRLVIHQTGLMGLTAGLLSLPVGLTMAVVMIHVINRRAFGWSLEMIVDPGVLLSAVGVALVSALLAALYPAYRMARVSPAEALREE